MADSSIPGSLAGDDYPAVDTEAGVIDLDHTAPSHHPDPGPEPSPPEVIEALIADLTTGAVTLDDPTPTQDLICDPEVANRILSAVDRPGVHLVWAGRVTTDWSLPDLHASLRIEGSVGGYLTVDGSVGGNLTIDGSVDWDLNLTGSVRGNLTIEGSVGGHLAISGSGSVGGHLTVSGSGSVGVDLTVRRFGSVRGDLTIVEGHVGVDYVGAGLVEFGRGDVLVAGGGDLMGADGASEVA